MDFKWNSLSCNGPNAKGKDIGTKDLPINLKPQVSPDQTETFLGSGNIFKNIFRLDWVGDSDFGLVRVGIFLT